ncbi:MAG TPA: cobalt ECF transporter T component CbiQ [Bacteroidota bacterium]|nr:cobalt ECF transporter T component CbiQ [Bacteroidota bacterium]
MRHDFLDRYSRLSSPVHRLPAGLKLASALAIVLSIVAVPMDVTWFFGSVGALLLVIVAVSRIPWRFVLGRLLLLEPLAVGVAGMALLQHNGFPLFLGILTRSTLCLLAAILTSNTTPFSEVLASMRRVRIPTLFITVLALAYRYLFVLIDEGERVQRARSSRSFGGTRKNRWLLNASLIGQLFVRSTERAERIYAAMAARGWK